MTAATRTKRQPSHRTIERCAKIRMVIDALRLGELSRDEIGEIIGFGPSGARKYINAMREHAVIELARYIDPTPNSIGHPMYCISPNAIRVQEYVDSLAIGNPLVTPKNIKKAARVAATVDPGRHFHVMVYDTHFAVNIRRTPVAPDPRALPTDFFAPSTSAPIERRQVERPVIPVPSAWPSPQQYVLAVDV